MNLSNKKRIAAQLLKCGENRVKFNTSELPAIKEAITKSDIRALIKDKTIEKKKEKGISRSRFRKNLEQKRKGRRSGPGRKSGTHKARLPKKVEWMNKIRAIRDLLKTLREKDVINPKIYRILYRKSKGGFFRSRRHIKLYIEEHNLGKK
tara:strand:+ start:201 stop:650 length:450 start_codon:yes stop_codon:yes gene_type:complete